ncbi:MAG: ABC transporter substrate-binding protein, partial [Deltaproteobacteria bacterium]|nr:ABC transporter substrate-binding protein [Deltaproteobacteria bacterium]
MRLVLLGLLVAANLFAKIPLALNWKPEPQFGGFYQTQIGQMAKTAKSDGVELEIMPGGAGTPTVQMVAAGKVPFGVASADEVVLARDRGMLIVALMAVYQTNPQGIMTHPERKLNSIAEVYAQDGTLGIQRGLGYSLFLEKKYGTTAKVKRVPYAGGIAPFLADANYSQQCFVTSEPLLVKKQGKTEKTFLIADAGYNPYTTVVVAKKDYVEKNGPQVAKVVALLKKSWAAYVANPAAANEMMHKLNPTMDPETFQASAEAQKDLIAGG